jgi:hypothetical protein
VRAYRSGYRRIRAQRFKVVFSPLDRIGGAYL